MAVTGTTEPQTKARCFKCGGPMPKGWFFVKWCDTCLAAHNAGLADGAEAELAEEEATDA